MKEIIQSPLLLTLVSIGLIYILGFSLVYLKKPTAAVWKWGLPKKN